jgi:DNA-binding transcriptional MocR family regulator
MRKLFKRRFQIMQEGIKEELPAELRSTYMSQGGLYFWLSLPAEFDSEVLYREVLERNVAFLPGKIFRVNQEPTPFFRLSFAAVDETQIIKGMKILGQAINEVLSKGNKREEREEGFTPLL